MEDEVWKDIPGYEPYQASNLGRIRNGKKGKTENCKKLGTPLKTRVTERGYEELKLSINKQRVHMLVHRLVALAFIPNPDNKQFVDHIDTNRLNNNVSNLRWTTISENANNPNTIANRYKSSDIDKLINNKRNQILKLEEEIRYLETIKGSG
jgi:hypothetical protein